MATEVQASHQEMTTEISTLFISDTDNPDFFC